MDHLLEVLKIIEGALNADSGKVVAYAEQLAQKLEKEGEPSAAKRVRRALANSKTRQLSFARADFSQVPLDGESRVSLADERVVAPDEVTVFLEPALQEELDRFLRYMKGADRLESGGVGVAPSLLLYGPPGCGKTEIARLVAARLSLPLITARTDGLISSFLGSTAKNLRRLFEHAMGRPCVLFLDEFDALAKLRDDQRELGELKRVVVSLLQNIDALDNQTVLVAATNHEHLLDPAVWRRFAFKIRVSEPSAASRERLFGHFLGTYSTSPKDLQLYGKVSETLTGADIRQISEDAKREAILDNQDAVPSATVLRRIVQCRAPLERGEQWDLSKALQTTRELNPKVFTYRRLADIYGISPTYAHKLLAGATNDA